ncbi:zinc-dependent alcohol dehydrogenase [Romboutsia sp.]|uniref:zinc-dependent alcohol dehydrogenase n=1 Tax=Romboutsia sp. TaxID=1965302 RepID=UPI003F3BF868
MLMKAVRKLEHGNGFLGCVEVEEPKVSSNTVKIKVEYCGICGSDVHIVEGLEPIDNPLPLPVTLGHEFSGTIVEIGENVKNFKVGDRVTSNVCTNFCGKCINCLTESVYNCSQSKNMGYETDGAMAEYVCMEEFNVFKLPDNISFEEGAQVEPVCVAAHAVLECVDIKPTDIVVIMGAGPIGLLVLQFVKACGAKAILVGKSTSANKLALGKELGADYIFENDKCDVIKEVMIITGRKGADFVFECSGADICITQAIMMTRKKGTIVELAITSATGSTIHSYLYAVMNEMKIQFAFGHTYATWPKAIELMSTGKIRTKELVSHKFSFEDYDKAFHCKDQNKIKILLHP